MELHHLIWITQSSIHVLLTVLQLVASQVESGSKDQLIHPSQELPVVMSRLGDS